MKNSNTMVFRLVVIIVIAFSFSCKKLGDSPQPSGSKSLAGSNSTLYVPETIFTAEQHLFTDIHICYDDKVFLLENGKLKRLIDNALVDVALPASVYANFHPTYLAISKDFTFYLRAATGIKIIKGGRVIKEYKVGQSPLQDFTTETFGERNIAVDETDQSLIVGVPRLFNPGLVSTLKITKDGQASLLSQDDGDTKGGFFTAFDIGGTPGQLWFTGLSSFNDNYYSQLYIYKLTTPLFNYTLQHTYGIELTNHSPFPLEGKLDAVGFNVMAAIKISKDAETIYLKTGEYDPGPQTTADLGDVFRIRDNMVTHIAENVENKRMAVSKDGKTLYLAGKGLYKINF
jgi:hypothetical protein